MLLGLEVSYKGRSLFISQLTLQNLGLDCTKENEIILNWPSTLKIQVVFLLQLLKESWLFEDNLFWVFQREHKEVFQRPPGNNIPVPFSRFHFHNKTKDLPAGRQENCWIISRMSDLPGRHRERRKATFWRVYYVLVTLHMLLHYLHIPSVSLSLIPPNIWGNRKGKFHACYHLASNCRAEIWTQVCLSAWPCVFTLPVHPAPGRPSLQRKQQVEKHSIVNVFPLSVAGKVFL